MPPRRRTPPQTRRHPQRLGQLVVTVTGVQVEGQREVIHCLDNFGNEFEVDYSVRPKGQGHPDVGERWVLSRTGGSQWIFDFQIGAPPRVAIDGTRDGLHPVAVQMLETLAREGLVFDGTIGGTVIPPLTDANDPMPPLGPDEEPMQYDEWWDDIEEDPLEIPEASNGPKIESEEDEEERQPRGGDNKGGPSRPKWHPLYLGSYNCKRTLGNQRVRRDMARITKSRMQVVGFQEMAGDQRDAVCQTMGNMGWNYYRPKASPNSDENTIFWREGEFTLLDSGWHRLSDNVHPPGTPDTPPRFYVWVKLRHRKSDRIFYFISTHLLAYIEGLQGHKDARPRRHGHPSSGGNLTTHMSKTFSSIVELREQFQRFGDKHPVFTVGDFNIDAFADRRVRDPRFPYVQFKRVGTFSNWDLIKHRPNFATAFGRHIDQLWVTRPKAHQVRLVNHWIFTGYHSDHRPVMVKALIRDKATKNRKRR